MSKPFPQQPAVMLTLALLPPTLLAVNPSPSATLLNGLLAVAGWGALLWAPWRSAPLAPALRAQWTALAALGLLALAVLASVARGLPLSLGDSALALLLAAAAVLAGAGTLAAQDSRRAAQAFASAMLLAALLSALIACIQVYAPGWADGLLIARSGLPGRAVGNLRQPNHLSSLLLWGLIALVPLAQSGRWFAWRLDERLAAALAVLLTLAVVLSASRTGTLGVLLLAGWGLVDRRLARRVRIGLLALPLVYLACWLAMAGWAHETAHAFGAEARLSEGDISSSRFGIWSNTLALIGQQPWTGVGFGEFNFAWTLTPFPGRPVAFFDHTHNLPLQLAVELGLPLAGLVLALLCAGLVLAGRRAWRQPGEEDGALARSAFMTVLMIAVHSLLEYPLWYAYFLLPAAWAWGQALRQPPAEAVADGAAGAAAPLRWAGVLMCAGALYALFDYGKEVDIYTSGDGSRSLAERIERGQRSLFFGHLADYAAATVAEPPSQALQAFDSTTHALLDTRLMIAWARALDGAGQPDRARYLVERLREFRNPEAREFLGECQAPRPADAPEPFQCRPPEQPHGWREFLPGAAR